MIFLNHIFEKEILKELKIFKYFFDTDRNDFLFFRFDRLNLLKGIKILIGINRNVFPDNLQISFSMATQMKSISFGNIWNEKKNSVK